MEEFLNVIEEKSSISDEKVAGYLVKYGERPISATFKALDYVLVDRQVWLETNYLLRNKANRKALAHSIDQLGDSNKNHLLTLEEFARLTADDEA